VADLEPLAARTGFQTRELMRFLKAFQKLVNPATKGLDQGCFSEFMNKIVQLDQTDDIMCKRLFEVQNTRGAYYLVFEQIVELLQILKKGDTTAKAELFYRIVDVQATGWLGIADLEEMFDPGERASGAQLNIIKERRKITLNKIMSSIYTVLDKKKDARIGREEFLNAVCLHPDVTRFFDRMGFLIMNPNVGRGR